MRSPEYHPRISQAWGRRSLLPQYPSNRRSPVAIVNGVAYSILSSLQFVQQLLAYYANWRTASRFFDEELDTTLNKATLPSEHSSD